jgi:hypothetical protein
MMSSGVIDCLLEAYEEAEVVGGELLKQLIAMALLEASRAEAGGSGGMGSDEARGNRKRRPFAPGRRAESCRSAPASCTEGGKTGYDRTVAG